MGIISNCFGFNFSKGENSNKNTNPNFELVILSLEVIILQSNLLIENPEVENENDIGQVWQVWGRSPAVVCHHRELQQLLNRHCRFFHRPVRKKGNLKGCQKCWNYLDIFALLYCTLIFVSNSFGSGSYFIIDWRPSIFGGKSKLSKNCIVAAYMRLNVVIGGFVKSAVQIYN